MICSGQALPADLDTTDDDPGSRAEGCAGGFPSTRPSRLLLLRCDGTGGSDGRDSRAGGRTGMAGKSVAAETSVSHSSAIWTAAQGRRAVRTHSQAAFGLLLITNIKGDESG